MTPAPDLAELKRLHAAAEVSGHKCRRSAYDTACEAIYDAFPSIIARIEELETQLTSPPIDFSGPLLTERDRRMMREGAEEERAKGK